LDKLGVQAQWTLAAEAKEYRESLAIERALKEDPEKGRQWLEFAEQFAEHKVEPNSGLGQAITYMTKRWEKLTLFLRQAGAPLDNNLCERALKKAILHRKNALFYKTQNGAHVGDLFMSLIHTCQFCGANPFQYLTELQEHSEDVARSPQQWLP
jgi:transposase